MKLQYFGKWRQESPSHVQYNRKNEVAFMVIGGLEVSPYNLAGDEYILEVKV